LEAGEVARPEQHGHRLIPQAVLIIFSNLRKIKILLQALEHTKRDIEYFALDVSKDELERTLSAVPNGLFKHVKCFGLHGTYDDGLKWLKSTSVRQRPKSILSMGSSIGNFTRPDAAKFLSNFATVLAPGDTLLIGIDACKSPTKVYHAYNDRKGITHRFILNGLKHANRLLGVNSFDVDHWQVIGEYDRTAGRHHAFVSPDCDVIIDGVLIRKDELVRIEESYKWSSEETARLWDAAGLAEGAKWANSIGDYGKSKYCGTHVVG
jgi:EasF-like predicted methyltransferase